MTIWLQKSASIEKRTNPLKFDHFRSPKPYFTASDLSTKVSHGFRLSGAHMPMPEIDLLREEGKAKDEL